MKRYEQTRKNSVLKIDGKPLDFVKGVLSVKVVSKKLQALVDAGYLKEVSDVKSAYR